MATFAWGILPAVFLLTLFAVGYPDGGKEIDLPLLLLLPIFGVALESVLMHATADNQERFDRRRRLWLRSIGVTSLLLSVFAVGLRVGEFNLSAISDLQIYFPYHAVISSPGLLLCGITAFCAIFLLTTDNPVQLEEEQSLNHSMQYATVFVQKMWVFALLCFWVYVFGGGAKGPIVKILFPCKVVAAILVFSVLQVSFPKIRSADAGELAARWLLPLCLIGFFMEAVWVGVRG